jgi:CheY-like chemotaxis protein
MENSAGAAWTILVAEDDEGARLLMQRAYNKIETRAKLQMVRNGEEAIEYVAGRGKFQDREKYPFPTLLLLDVNMPRLDGFDVLHWIKSRRKLRSLIVTMLTCSDEPRDITRAYELGANSYLVKSPLYPEFAELVKCMDNYWLKHNRMAAFMVDRKLAGKEG